MSDLDGFLATTIVVLLLMMGSTWNESYSDNESWINENGEVPDCVYASVEVIDKWYIESNYTFVLNTTTVYGFHEQNQVIAHLIVTKGMFDATNISDVHEGWICSDDRITITELIANQVIRIVDGQWVY